MVEYLTVDVYQSLYKEGSKGNYVPFVAIRLSLFRLQQRGKIALISILKQTNFYIEEGSKGGSEAEYVVPFAVRKFFASLA